MNIKVRGFDSPEQLREHLEELDDTPDQESPQDRRLRQEIASLRAQLEDLKLRVEEGWSEDEHHEQLTVGPSSLSSLILPVTAVLGLVFILSSRASNERTLFFH
ncbi:hypothetical protein [Rhizobium rhizophilum]|uniref:Uncharacterized protein n=1 Tax=Rhizobium rhizophilum TaxID=1850373 RepID=A0ABY2QR71_9HYPH|nr:hypothetical protein [Rhizobium rhizophilum]THV12508.1 hypothetical protein E9677_17260 [Rhizobium rhizophilum]